MILGAMMLVDAPIPEMRLSWRALLPVAVTMAILTIALVRAVVRAQRLKPTTGAEGLVGQEAVAETDLAPLGWVRVQGERWRAMADGAAVGTGDRVRVAAVDGLTLRVRKEG
jgi:membrane-bound serine protease (ClpP class)